jgi:UPF0148 protein
MQDNSNSDASIKRMADLLRQGETLTDLACPVCSSPLFRLRNGTLWCVKDEKKVIIVKEGEETEKSSSNAALDTLEETISAKIQEMQSKIKKTDNVDELGKMTATLSELLNSLEKIKRMKKS